MAPQRQVRSKNRCLVSSDLRLAPSKRPDLRSAVSAVGGREGFFVCTWVKCQLRSHIDMTRESAVDKRPLSADDLLEECADQTE
jgi:hypothetical protein